MTEEFVYQEMGPHLADGRVSRFKHVKFADPLDAVRYGSAHAMNLAPPAMVEEKEEPLSEEQAAFVRWVFREVGLDARQYRAESLRRRLPACLRAVRADDLHTARRMMRESRSLVNAAAAALIIGVTGFFRDPAVFEVLARDVVPVLPDRPRIWSAGCSDGSELYSVAMLLDEAGRLEGATLLGTDCRREALVRADKGVYDELALKDVSASARERYFRQVEGLRAGVPRQVRVVDRLRAQVRWRCCDILAPMEMGSWDLILCRNVAMYFRPAVARGLWERLAESLMPGGFLVSGRAERPVSLMRPVAPCVYRRAR